MSVQRSKPMSCEQAVPQTPNVLSSHRQTTQPGQHPQLSNTSSCPEDGRPKMTRRFSTSNTNGYYQPEGTNSDELDFRGNPQLFSNAPTDDLYNQLRTHCELAHRAVVEIVDRRKDDIQRLKDEFTKKEQEQRLVFEKRLKESLEVHRRDHSRYKQDMETKVRSLEIQLAERVAAQNAMEKAHKGSIESLERQLSDHKLRIHKVEGDHEELQRKHSLLLNEKQELQHDYDNLHEQIGQMKSMFMGLGSSKKRRVSEL